MSLVIWGDWSEDTSLWKEISVAAVCQPVTIMTVSPQVGLHMSVITTFGDKVVSFPGNKTIFQDSGKHWEIPDYGIQ